MIEQYLDQRAKLDRQVVERAMTDTDFRARLVADTRGTVAAEFGVNLPANADVRVVEESANSHVFVLPAFSANPEGELSDSALETVAGGLDAKTDGGFEFCWTLICIY